MMSKLFEPGNPPRFGVAARLWRKFVDEYGFEPDSLMVINPGIRQREAGAASWAICSERVLGSAVKEILIQSDIPAKDWAEPFAGIDLYDRGTGQFWWPK